MPEVKFVHQGTNKILLMDFSEIVDHDLLSGLIEESIRIVRTESPGRSVLAVIDLTGTHVNKTVIASLKALSRNNGPLIRAIAFVGLNWVWSFAASTLLRITRRTNHRVIHRREQALQWLSEQ